MRYWGELLYIILACCSGGSFLPIIISLLIGYFINKAWNSSIVSPRYFSNQETKKHVFFCITFQVMGYLTKSKGRVTESDINHANKIMSRMQLNHAMKIAAQEEFRKGKKANFPLCDRLHEFRRICFRQPYLINLFLEIQIQTAIADGFLHPKEQQILYIIAEELGIDKREFDELLKTINSNIYFENQRKNDHNNDYFKSKNPQELTLKNACKILGVNLQDDSLTIKRAYRRLMNEYHPDKLLAKGLPKEMIEIAKQKTQIIQQAYNILKLKR